MKDLGIERWAACIVPGAVIILAIAVPLSLLMGFDGTFPNIGSGNAALLVTGLLLLSYIVVVALWGLAYWNPLNSLLMWSNRHEYRVLWGDRYARERAGLPKNRTDSRWMDLVAAVVLPSFAYGGVTKHKHYYTVFENAMTQAYLEKESSLLKRIIWEREIIGMLQCLVLAFHALWMSFLGTAVYVLAKRHVRPGIVLVICFALAAGLTVSLVLHLRLRNRLLARDVVVFALGPRPEAKEGSEAE